MRTLRTCHFQIASLITKFRLLGLNMQWLSKKFHRTFAIVKHREVDVLINSGYFQREAFERAALTTCLLHRGNKKYERFSFHFKGPVL